MQQQCKVYISKVREVRFIKVGGRQVSKFNRLLHKNNINRNLDGRQQSPQLVNNNHTSNINKQMQGHTCINNNQAQGSSSSNVSQGNKWVVNLSKSRMP